ncbi:1-acylglycerol-3-phosphate O-acyltransferase [Martelella alba]|uniref:1-acyl-sn-glycerol-3-phosphate acyltransferase n=1 Tax=Martelella alba TaxID=2590451 RepID=A0ABY2SI61_9HYPH|nr:1-acylglycerol-3-phosphate O-acyltransferase [Martelella alba]TKI04870.1 1-acylglycerol-3-phosphate O-acyltransferase [Martelella alba]
MLAIIRIILVVILSACICLIGLVFCLFSPRNPRHVATFGRWFGRLAPLLGLKVEIRYPSSVVTRQNCIYIANHQNNYDMVTAARVVQPRTVTVGKKSLLWIPLFGQLYWLTGNILIDRENRTKAHGTINAVVNQIKKKNISIWMFPEGTRSRGRGLLPFKSGAFHAAIAAGVPIVPICVSSTANRIKLNRWSNGLVIVEMLPPVDTSAYSRDKVRVLTEDCHRIMAAKLAELDAEVVEREGRAGK